MTWFVTSTNETEAAKSHYLMFLAVSFDFSSAFIRLWSGLGDLSIGGNTYTGVGSLASVSSTAERSSLSVDRKVYQLSGVDPAIVSEADIDASFGRAVTEYFGFINPDTGQLLATPETNFEGEIGSVRRVDGADPRIIVTADHRLAILDQPDGWRWTHEHQQEFYSGDLGFEHAASVGLKDILWGGSGVVPGSGGPGNRRDPTYVP